MIHTTSDVGVVQCALRSFIAGIIIPLLCIVGLTILSVLPPFVLPDALVSQALMLIALLQYFVWPSYLLLLGMRGLPVVQFVGAVTVSILMNGLLYSILGVLIWRARSLIRARTARL